MKRVAVTGSKGVVGSVIVPDLAQSYDVVEIDLPEVDARDPRQLNKALRGTQTIIHLAGVFGSPEAGKEGYRSPYRDPVNEEIFNNLLHAAQKTGVAQFIHASSIHIEDSFGYSAKFQKTPLKLLRAHPGAFSTTPWTGYAQTKRNEERALDQAADNFPEGVVSVRLGGVSRDNQPPDGTKLTEAQRLHERRTWLKHGDLTRLIRAIIEKPVPGYQVLYAVSRTDGRFHDTTNAFGWKPL